MRTPAEDRSVRGPCQQVERDAVDDGQEQAGESIKSRGSHENDAGPLEEAAAKNTAGLRGESTFAVGLLVQPSALDMLRSSDSFLRGPVEIFPFSRHSRRAVIGGSLMDQGRFTPRLGVLFAFAGALLVVAATSLLGGADPPAKPKTEAASNTERTPPSRLPLTREQQERLDRVIAKALEFLASQQQEDGSFRTKKGAEPAVTSLCAMAFLARGHMPGKPPYGQRINHAIDYILKQQDPKSGAIYQRGPGWPLRGNYNHAISALMLCDAYPEMDAAYRDDEANSRRRERVEEAIRQRSCTRRKDQTRSKSHSGAAARGGICGG